jgi:hypothetical protein
MLIAILIEPIINSDRGGRAKPLRETVCADLSYRIAGNAQLPKTRSTS